MQFQSVKTVGLRVFEILSFEDKTNLIELLKSLEKDYPKNIKIIKED